MPLSNDEFEKFMKLLALLPSYGLNTRHYVAVSDVAQLVTTMCINKISFKAEIDKHDDHTFNETYKWTVTPPSSGNSGQEGAGAAGQAASGQPVDPMPPVV